MTYVIAEPCIGTKDTACVDACPVDCIHPKKDEREVRARKRCYTSIRWSASTAVPACRFARFRPFLRWMICRKSGRPLRRGTRSISGGSRQLSASRIEMAGLDLVRFQRCMSEIGHAPFLFGGLRLRPECFGAAASDLRESSGS